MRPRHRRGGRPRDLDGRAADAHVRGGRRRATACSARPTWARTRPAPRRTSRRRASWSTRARQAAASGAPSASACWTRPARTATAAMQFNAVVETNPRPCTSGSSLGFEVLATVPGGVRPPDRRPGRAPHHASPAVGAPDRESVRGLANWPIERRPFGISAAGVVVRPGSALLLGRAILDTVAGWHGVVTDSAAGDPGSWMGGGDAVQGPRDADQGRGVRDLRRAHPRQDRQVDLGRGVQSGSARPTPAMTFAAGAAAATSSSRCTACGRRTAA